MPATQIVFDNSETETVCPTEPRGATEDSKGLESNKTDWVRHRRRTEVNAQYSRTSGVRNAELSGVSALAPVWSTPREDRGRAIQASTFTITGFLEETARVGEYRRDGPLGHSRPADVLDADSSCVDGGSPRSGVTA
jgi:hypothetical protein